MAIFACAWAFAMTATDLLPLGVSRRGLVPGLRNIKRWMAGTSPLMTVSNVAVKPPSDM